VQLRDASKAIAASGSRLSPLYVGALAQAYGKTGRIADGLSLLTRVLAGVREASNHMDESWLSNLKGELFLNQDPPDVDEAERCFRNAIELAQEMGAKSPELRASISLARLLAKHGQRKEARTMLAEIYGWFTEGFDTPDLKDAKSLLEDLKP
jgi:predicted ATPase